MNQVLLYIPVFTLYPNICVLLTFISNNMSMRRILQFAGILFLIFSCKDDEEPSYSFKNQDASGKIGNVAWTYQDGRATIDGSGADARLNISLIIAQQSGDQGCDIFQIEGDEVFFGVPAVVGLYKLSFNLNSGTGQTATLFDDEETFNHIAAEGAIEILTITATQVTGRIDARGDQENTVNGNFEVDICQ
jgi:hypothetical protein